MNSVFDRFGRASAAPARNDTNAAITASKRRRVWHVVVGANVTALVAAIAGCFFMMRTQGIRADVAAMRDEVGESLTMMTIGGASEAVSRHIPKLIGTTARWDRKFAARSESFRGLDREIDQVQSMHRLGATAERWRRELEGVSPMQRNEYWQKNLKAQVEAEQKKWPNRTHEKGASEWLLDWWKDFWFGMKHAFVWPVGIYERTAELVRGGGASSGCQSVIGCAISSFRIVFRPFRCSVLQESQL